MEFKTYLKFLLWGTNPRLPLISSVISQQTIALWPLWLGMHDGYGLILSLITFSVIFHLPNLLLILATAFFITPIYLLVYYEEPLWFNLVALLGIHTWLLTLLKDSGLDTRVWNFFSKK